MQQQTLSVNPMYVNALSHQQLQQQQQQQQHLQQQATLSPTALHSPPAPTSTSSFYPTSSAAPMQTNLTASSSNSASSSSSSAETLTQRRNRLQAKMKGLANLTGGGAVKAFVNAIDDCGASDVDPATRLEIITRIRDKSPAHFLRAWCENVDAMDITREWLKDGATKRDNGLFEETIMPLLQVSWLPPCNAHKYVNISSGHRTVTVYR